MKRAELQAVDEKPLEMRKTNESTFERIYKWYHSSTSRIQLSDEEENIRNRWEKAWYIMCDKLRTKKQTVDLIKRLYNVSKSVAYDDVRNAENLFGEPGNASKDAKRRIAEHQFLEGAKRALRAGDLEMHERYMNRFAEINGLKDQESENQLAGLLKELKANTIVVVSDPQALQAQAQKLQEELTVDVPHTEL